MNDAAGWTRMCMFRCYKLGSGCFDVSMACIRRREDAKAYASGEKLDSVLRLDQIRQSVL